MPPKSNLKMHVHILDKTIIISCGVGTQRLRWLGNVAISRWDEEEFQGWRYLGVPLRMTNAQGVDLDLGGTIRDLFEDGEEVTVTPSVDPSAVTTRA